MTKNEYRAFFAECKPFLKLKNFCELAGVNPVSLSRFMKGQEWDYEMSLQKLNELYIVIHAFCETIA